MAVLPEKNPVDKKQWLQVSAMFFKFSIPYVDLILVWIALDVTQYKPDADVVHDVGAGAIRNEHRDVVECAVVLIKTPVWSVVIYVCIQVHVCGYRHMCLLYVISHG